MRSFVFTLFLVSLIIVPVVREVQADDSLVLHLSFDKVEGSIVKDSSQYGNDGTIKGGTKSAAGKFGGALEFDGTTGVIEVPHSDSLNVESSFTHAVWAYPIDKVRTQAARSDNIAEKGFWAGSWLSHIRYDDLKDFRKKWLFAIASGGWNPVFWPADTHIEPNNWFHLALTWDGKTRRLYVNGKLDGSDEPAGSAKSNAEILYIGGGRDPHYYEGIFDEFSLWNRVLSEGEIKANMEQGTAAVHAAGKLTATWGSIKGQ